MKKKLVCLLLCLVLVLSLLPAAVLAADDCGGNPGQCVLAPFKDAPGYSNWAHAGIEYCVNHGLMSGTSPTTFEPKTTMSRAMLVTVLYRMDGAPGAGTSKFSDVPSGQWYSAAVSWAADHGIVSGVGGGKFDPNGSVTREQLATILYRYAGYKGYDTSRKDNLTGFADSGKVGQWFVDGVKWAVAAGLISGAAQNGKTYLTPQGAATREQVAAILMRFAKSVTTGKPLTITKQPEDVRVPNGTRVHFDVEVEGGKAPYTYQWQYTYAQNGVFQDWMDLTASWATGANTPSLSMTIIAADIYMKYRYRCRVTDAAGKQVYSDDAQALEYIPLSLRFEPYDEYSKVGQTAGFWLEATGGTPPYSYLWEYTCDRLTQWYTVGTWATGRTERSMYFRVTEEDFTDHYLYRCKVTDALGDTIVTKSVCVKKDESLEITTQPKDMTVPVGSPVTLSVAAEGGRTPYTYRWQFRYQIDGTYSAWQNASGSWAQGYNTDNLSFTVVQEDHTNWYQYRCEVTDARGDVVYSKPAAMVPPGTPVMIKTQPTDIEGKAGDYVTFTVDAMGGKAPYTYQWQFKSTEVDWVSMNSDYWDGWNTDRLGFYVKESHFEYHYQYRCVVTDANGKKAYSDTVQTITPLRIRSQSNNAYTEVGRLARFSVTPEGGVEPYSYQWQICRQMDDGNYTAWSNVSDTWSEGGQSSFFSFTVGQTEFQNHYFYRCVVTDALGYQVISETRHVGVLMKVVTEPHWIRERYQYGVPVTTAVEVTGGTPPYTYQWWWERYDSVTETDYPLEKYPCTTNQLVLKDIDSPVYYSKVTFDCTITDAEGQMISTKLHW